MRFFLPKKAKHKPPEMVIVCMLPTKEELRRISVAVKDEQIKVIRAQTPRELIGTLDDIELLKLKLDAIIFDESYLRNIGFSYFEEQFQRFSNISIGALLRKPNSRKELWYLSHAITTFHDPLDTKNIIKWLRRSESARMFSA